MTSTAPSGARASGRRIVVLASGNGTNAQAVIEACQRGAVAAEVVCVVSDRGDAGVLRRADQFGVASTVLEPEPGELRRDYDVRLGEVVGRFDPDLVILLGWMRILGMEFLRRFPANVINLHPALPGELPGTRAIERAFDEARAGLRTHTGVMVHLVPDERVDAGPVLATTTVPIESDDSLDDLTARVHRAEHELIVSTLAAHFPAKETPA